MSDYWGNRIKFLRRAAQLTQAEFAEAVGMTRASVSVKEVGKVAWSVRELVKIAEFFDIDPGALLQRKDASFDMLVAGYHVQLRDDQP